jgi:hypothetical protein
MQDDLTKIAQEEVPENVLSGISGAGIGRGLAATTVGAGATTGAGAAFGSHVGRGEPDRGAYTASAALL